MATEYREIASYDILTGDLTITEPLKYYHWGQSEGTEDTYGKDIRGEVGLLNRNIIISGEDIESWGGQIVAGETVEFNTDGEMVWRVANTHMDNVEIYNCSQIDTEKAAIRLSNALNGEHSFTNMVLHNGLAWGISVTNSKNVLIKDNVIFNFRNWGIKIDKSSGITVDDNLVMHILERTTFKSVGMSIDKWGGISMCGDKFSKCDNLKARRNIIAGIPWAGFTGPAVACDSENTDFADNVAHSIGNKYGGYGAIIFADKHDSKQATCMKAQGMFAYKTKMGVTGGYNAGPLTNKFTEHTVLDSGVGMGLGWTGAPTFSGAEPLVEAYNNIFYGNSPIPDCPENESGRSCN